MASSIFPTGQSGIFIPSLWQLPSGQFTQEYADLHYLKFPIGQGSQTLPQNLTVSGGTTLGATTISNLTIAGETASTTIGSGTFSTTTIGTGGFSTVKISGGYLYSDSNNTVYNRVSSYGGGGGFSNTFFGFNAGKAITTGQSNVAVGDCFSSSVDGYFNSCLGEGAGDSISSGTNNTCIGYGAGLALTSGTNNTFIGNQTGSSSTTVTNSTAIGAGATITASNQIMMGTSSQTVAIPNTVTATGLITASAGVNTTTVGYTYSTLPTFTSSQIGYRVDYSLPSGNQGVGMVNYGLSLGVGVWQLVAYMFTGTLQTNSFYHEFVIGSTRYAFANCAAWGGASYVFLPSMTAIIPLTATTTVNYAINWIANGAFSLTNSASRYYAVRIA